MSARELKVRVTHALIQKGWTFQQDKVEQIQQEQQQKLDQDRHARFLERARAHWGDR